MVSSLALKDRDNDGAEFGSCCTNCGATVSLPWDLIAEGAGVCHRCHGPFRLSRPRGEPFRDSGRPDLVGRPPCQSFTELPVEGLRIDRLHAATHRLLLLLPCLAATALLTVAGAWVVGRGLALFARALGPGYGPDLLDGPEVAAVGLAGIALAGRVLRSVAWAWDGREVLSLEGSTLARRRTAWGVTFTQRRPLDRLSQITVTGGGLSHPHLVLHFKGRFALPVARGTGQEKASLEWLKYRLERQSSEVPVSAPRHVRSREMSRLPF